ncbi:MAG: KH domain-containing protein [Anaerolineales bacterium]
MKKLIEYIAKSLVDDPEAVQVQEMRRGNSVNIVLRVAKEDMGRVIGKNGRVANAIRVLLRVAAVRSGQRVTLDVEEPK